MAQSKSTKSKSKANKKTTVKLLKINKLNIKLVAAVFVVAGLIGGYLTYKNIANAAIAYTWSANQFQDMSAGSYVNKPNGQSYWVPGDDTNGYVWVASTVSTEYKYCAELGGDYYKVRIEVIQNNVMLASSPSLYPSEWRLYTGRSAACLNVAGTSVPGRRIVVRADLATTSAREDLKVYSITRETRL